MAKRGDFPLEHVGANSVEIGKLEGKRKRQKKRKERRRGDE